MLTLFSHAQLFVTLWTIVHQAPLSMGFSRQEYWSGLPCTPPGVLPNQGIEPSALMCPASAGSLPLAPPGKPTSEKRDVIFPLGVAVTQFLPSQQACLFSKTQQTLPYLIWNRGRE